MTTSAQRINKTTFDNLALKGYDPVAYFAEERAAKGSKQFVHDYAGAIWRFVSTGNRDLFVQDPERYMPQYGGYCAWGISQAKFFDGDPEVWKVVNGKLYVNYNKEIEKAWEQDILDFIEKADANWLTLEQAG
jgi:hypothetical protein